MSKINFQEIDQKWQKKWEENQTYKVVEDTKLPKYYSLEMFPYPSGAGLHVGHPLGYVASDIFARYKRHNGYNVLHPMGFDTFGLPAEQYAIQTGQHPAMTTQINIKRYKEQLVQLGLSYDWSREVVTSDPSYYKWTQWIFSLLYDHWYDNSSQKARPISDLLETLCKDGNIHLNASCTNDTPHLSSEEWNNLSYEEQSLFLQNYRIAYLAETSVNWCPGLGTVLANEEVKDGFSERGGYPVVKKKMKQWCMRITAYADRLLEGLEQIDFSKSLKIIQQNWIGKSSGLEFALDIKDLDSAVVKVFTTRPDTIYGTSFVAISPQSDIIQYMDLGDEAKKYITDSEKKSELERKKEDNITGVFSGYYATNPINGNELPIWIADYVLAGYGTGAVMGVPAHDERDYLFAQKYNLPILKVVDGGDLDGQANMSKEGIIINSDFLNGMTVEEAIKAVVDHIETKGDGRRVVNYKMRDSIFSRQRYWGEPFPIFYKGASTQLLENDQLPLVLPEIDEYKPTPEGDPPLGRVDHWVNKDGYPLELNTMPGWAGSSWYFLRYMDPENDREFCSEEALKYWGQVDLYVGGSEHATGHLLYSRFWTKFLKDLGYVQIEEPFKKLINQGMIQGVSKFVYRIKGTNKFVSYNLRKEYQTSRMHVDISLTKNLKLDIDRFKQWRDDLRDSEFILEDGEYICGTEVEKMSKSKYNTVSPDEIIEKYGADSFRMYSMFLGPIENSKPWNTEGIDGVYRFLIKLWNMISNAIDNDRLSHSEPSEVELKTLHRAIKRINDDIERHSFNTCVSSFMIVVNELTEINSSNKTIFEDLLILLSPFAPHLAEEIWEKLGNKDSIVNQPYPVANEEYIIENEIEYPVSINGKTRTKVKVENSLTNEQIEEKVLAHSIIRKILNDKKPKKVIIVRSRIVNIVI